MKKIEIPSITAVLNSIRRMPADELLLVIEAANFELAQALADEELFNEAYDEMLARQHEADRCDDFLRRSFMLHGKTNALEGIK